MTQPADLLNEVHPGVWAENCRGFLNAPFHWEWYSLMSQSRLCVVAPREHAKTEVFAVNQLSHASIYQTGHWGYLFSNTRRKASEILGRIALLIEEQAPALLGPGSRRSESMLALTNGSRIDAASVGQHVRGSHPDLIVADDVLSERNTSTSYQRAKLNRWWFGTVAGMAHPGTVRLCAALGQTVRVEVAPTRIHLVGTPFHQADLLMAMRRHSLYSFRRYAAEFDSRDLVAGSWAVEAS